MKKIIIIAILALGFGLHTSAQQKAPTKYMLITIYPIDSYNRKLNMIVTREDTAQLLTHLAIDSHVKLKDFVAVYESLMLQTLKPYFDNGWKLVSSTTETEVFDGSGIVSATGSAHVTRFYLSKDE
jgi:hypothetical protein